MLNFGLVTRVKNKKKKREHFVENCAQNKQVIILIWEIRFIQSQTDRVPAVPSLCFVTNRPCEFEVNLP